MRGLAMVAGLLIAASGVRAEKPVLLTMDQAQEMALTHNQMLAAARAGVDRAKAMKMQTWAGYLPSVRISEGVMRSNDAVNAFGFRLKQERFTQADFAIGTLNHPAAITHFQTRIEVKQPLFNGGQAFYGRRQAGAGVKGAASALDQGIAQVRFETARAYWGVVLAREALMAVQYGLETAQAHARAAEVRHKEDVADWADVLAAQVRVAELQGEGVAAQNRLDEAMDGLALVMGMEMGARLYPSEELIRRPLGNDLDALVAHARQTRPDLLAAKVQAVAAQSGVGVARAALLPHLNAFAEATLDSDEMFARKGESWTVGAMLTWDVFSGGKSFGALREARAQAEAARALAAFKASDVVREVRAAFRDARAADARVEIADRALAHSEEHLRIVQLQYGQGLATSVDLLMAESELRRVRVQKAIALYELNVGLAKIAFVSGIKK